MLYVACFYRTNNEASCPVRDACGAKERVWMPLKLWWRYKLLGGRLASLAQDRSSLVQLKEVYGEERYRLRSCFRWYAFLPSRHACVHACMYVHDFRVILKRTRTHTHAHAFILRITYIIPLWCLFRFFFLTTKEENGHVGGLLSLVHARIVAGTVAETFSGLALLCLSPERPLVATIAAFSCFLSPCVRSSFP